MCLTERARNAQASYLPSTTSTTGFLIFKMSVSERSPLSKGILLGGSAIFLHAAYSTYEFISVQKSLGLVQGNIPSDVRLSPKSGEESSADFFSGHNRAFRGHGCYRVRTGCYSQPSARHYVGLGVSKTVRFSDSLSGLNITIYLGRLMKLMQDRAL